MMNSEEVINVCQAISHGNPRQVWNVKSNQRGTVLSCEGNELTVRVGRSKKVWNIEDCEERTIN